MVIAQPLPPSSQEQGHRALLSAIAAFFDRFAGSGLMGTLCFSMGPAPWLCGGISWDLPSGELTFCHGKSPFLMGKSTISMAIFNCYVSSPEGSDESCHKRDMRRHEDDFKRRLFDILMVSMQILRCMNNIEEPFC